MAYRYAPNPLPPVPPRRRRWPRVLAALLAVGVLIMTLAGVAVQHLSSSVAVVAIEDEHYDASQDPAPAVSPSVLPLPQASSASAAQPTVPVLPASSLDPSGPFSILVLGSDSRSGKGNKGYGQVAGQRSDTAMLVRVDEGHTRALVVSIPRDLVMDLPSCKTASGRTSARRERFNAAFSLGGAPCAMRAVEKLTGSRIDHVVVVDFNAFKHMTKAVGGVPVCLPESVKDKYSGLDLSAGWHLLSGQQALAYVRLRHGIADGSDISRMSRQQDFVRALVDKLRTSGLLTDPVGLYSLTSDLASDLALSSELSAPQDMAALALSLSGVDKIRFVTLPWAPSGDGATVVLDSSAAAPLLGFLSGSAAWPRVRPSDQLSALPSALPSSTASPLPSFSASPSPGASGAPAAPRPVKDPCSGPSPF